MPISINPGTCKQANLFESTVAFVLVKKLGNRIVGYKNVNVPVVVEIPDRDSEPFCGLRIQPFW